ncbi:MAG: hypothetical protein US40_C0008G0022 [Candidatus Roizmanbacteria bacterium GW2011_GWC2_37_13]|uniref:Nudix hydrolase domain-containing protein n=1 Tax=Candidatus Roizmanbacteria bacterium GW2011_GWC2_37_13 TaxID=1618486 RepID=A0A0G0G2K5_9BACT|nr:MAG: hypothetical protein US38_C0003G0022 [Candidatus Roizmanbacteria bacterium GW2011_GWC1_37_12]KKQ25428.1 MAG: hypothetical protein US40_C0008G0022 [Candidatus Roizmanbacteria bacterium GW2011_GWC2_37_13]
MKNDYISQLKKEVLKFKGKKVDINLIEKFLKKLSSTDKVTKELNIDEHLCAFFIPINKKTKSIYLGHHIKANSWIPPGGHIKWNEHPIKTVIREFEEELTHKISKTQIRLFNLSITNVKSNPRHPCKIHYDFWYLVNVPKVKFDFLKKEFYDAYWHDFDEAINKITVPHYKKIVTSVKDAI